MILLLDIGNTRIKWATLTDDGISEQRADVHATWNADDVRARVFGAAANVERVLVSNVGGERIGALVRDAAQSAVAIDPEFAISTAQFAGVRNAYPDPRKLGVDRWLALIAAHNERPGVKCIVSVGTAMTIDALDSTGRHLGGLILPGPELMVKSLLHNTSDIAKHAATGAIADNIFADNTLGAIHQGAVHALAALVDRSCESASAQLHQPAELLLTGGASDRIAGLLRSKARIIPDLVLRGLAVMARNKVPGVPK